MLHEISKCFDQESVYHLATILLENKCPGGGIGFIKRHTSAFGQPDWTWMAHMVLAEWCNCSKDKVFGGDLWKVLNKVHPQAARDFGEKLFTSAKSGRCFVDV